MKLLKNILPLLIAIFLVSSTYAQVGTIRGFVYDKKNSEPLPFVNISLKGTVYGASTDMNGYFSIVKIKEGKYTLEVSSLGFNQVSEPVTIVKNRLISKKYYLEESAITLEGITVSAEREEMRNDVRVSVNKIPPKDIKRVPTIGSEPDLAQYLQVLPGVVFTGDQGGQLYIRGGSPIQNKVLLDGMVVYNPFHSIGLFSVFDSDILRNADVYTGGFGAEYGGRISSIMDITTRDGNKKRLAGKVSASTFGSKILIEGPIIKFDEETGRSTSFLFSGKTSYLEESSKLFYNYIDTNGLPFNYNDFYGKISINGANGSKVNFFGYNFNDRVKYEAISDLNWDSYGIGSNVILVPDGSPVLIKANFSYSSYKTAFTGLDNLERFSSINGFNMGLSFVYFLGKNELDYGIETLGFTTAYSFYTPTGRFIGDDEPNSTTELAGYLKYKLNLGKLLIEPSFRLHFYASLPETSPEPRLGVKYNITDYLRFKFSGGLYSQNFISTSSDRDVVNLFYGFLSGPEDTQSDFNGEKVTTKLQKSRHAIAGFEIDLTRRLNLNIEGYYKQNIQLTNMNRNKIFDDNVENIDKPDYFKKDYVLETGDAYGVDFVLKYDYKRLYFWLVYSLGYVTRDDGVIQYNPHFDRRHNVNLVSSYTFGKHLNWEASFRWNLGSGFPFTQTQGFYEQMPFTQGISTDYTSTNGNMGVIYADLNGGRLPYYHRLDATVKRTFEFANESKLLATLSVTNVYNRENIFYFDRVEYERVNQLPFMPSIGVSYTF